MTNLITTFDPNRTQPTHVVVNFLTFAVINIVVGYSMINAGVNDGWFKALSMTIVLLGNFSALWIIWYIATKVAQKMLHKKMFHKSAK